MGTVSGNSKPKLDRATAVEAREPKARMEEINCIVTSVKLSE